MIGCGRRRATTGEPSWSVACEPLDADLGGRLVVRHGDPARVVPALAAEVEAAEVFVSADFAPYGSRRDDAVAGRWRSRARRSVGSGRPTRCRPGSCAPGPGDPYKVFTPFSKAWVAHGWPGPIRAPSSVPWAATSRATASPKRPRSTRPCPRQGRGPPSEPRGGSGMPAWPSTTSSRNDPGADATSRLSPYLKWGCLHPRQLLHTLGATPAERTFRTELCWREFYADVLHHRPETARAGLRRSDGRHRGRRPRVPPRGSHAWREGRTGYPIVDAGMRQLVAEGWMHNRVRMLVASFLVKDLHLDWTRGARHFMAHLVDGDLASNQHGWQWVAGTGTDAAPYFRIFNPVTQGERFDPRGTYVRRWVPELAAVPDQYVHHPWDDPNGPPAGLSGADGRPRRGARGGPAALRGRPRALRLSRGEPGGRPR